MMNKIVLIFYFLVLIKSGVFLALIEVEILFSRFFTREKIEA